ncbi:hypothetical protein CTI12_AA219290 [Artemisia annua]|uniref:RRM domain-containing protein n=1 Tax=Artemisia annua TaxID=35608 RepID=A0A2U1NWX6_ARTAN|nr:hypothetical protein CTI12_AA219290 [Artemisia annua]
MFHNFPNDWGMGNLWMLFKKYGTVFDMFMVQKRLRNGQRYSFVRFKNIVSVEFLLRRLRDIRIGSELLRVYLAYDRRGKEGDRNYRVKTSEEGSRDNRFHHKMNHDYVTKQGNGGADKRFDIRDPRRYNDVVRGKPSDGKEYRVDDNERLKDDKYRMLTIGEEDIGMDIFKRSIIGEVKKLSYLVRLPEICEAMGISRVEVKALGGLEVMLVFETAGTAANILRDVEHGLRRWVHKIRRCDDNYKPNLMIGRVCVHMVAKELIKEGLKIKVKDSIFNVNVIEEIRDVVEHCLPENINAQKNEEHEDGRMNMNEDRSDDGNMDERNNKTDENDKENDDDEKNGEEEMAGENNLDEDSSGGDRAMFRKVEHGGREPQEDQQSRVSSEVKVKDTFEEENSNYDTKAAFGNSEVLEKKILFQTSDKVSKKLDEMESGGIVNVNIMNTGPLVDEGVETTIVPLMDKNVDNTIGEQNMDGLIDGLTNQNKKSDIQQNTKSNIKLGTNLEENVSTEDMSDDEDHRNGTKGDSPPNPNGSGGNRHRKKRKKLSNGNFEGAKDIRFSHDLYKVPLEDGGDSEMSNENKCTRNKDGVYNVRSISENQLKEVGEQIGVTWDEVAGPRKGEIHARESDGNETKSGIVDEFWVEEVWGSKGFGFTQLTANGNSGGIILIWDANTFICKEAMGDESSWAGCVGYCSSVGLVFNLSTWAGCVAYCSSVGWILQQCGIGFYSEHMGRLCGLLQKCGLDIAAVWDWAKQAAQMYVRESRPVLTETDGSESLGVGIDHIHCTVGKIFSQKRQGKDSQSGGRPKPLSNG